MNSQSLYRVIAILLVGIAGVLLLGHDVATSGAVLTGAAQAIAGVVAGFATGVVAALLGVAAALMADFRGGLVLAQAFIDDLAQQVVFRPG